jgi:hypothetical protein
MKNIQDVPNAGPTGSDLVIDLYLNGHMEEPERVAFEVRMMEDPALFNRVQIIDALKKELVMQREALGAEVERPSALADIELINTVAAGTAQNDENGKLLILPLGLWMKQPFSLAASLLVAVLGFNAWRTGDPAMGPAIGVNTVVVLETTRGGGKATGFGQSPYLLQVDAGFDAGSRPYAVDLIDTSGASVTRLQNLNADPDGWVRLLVDAPLSGDYRLVLSWQQDNGQPAEREFALQVSP